MASLPSAVCDSSVLIVFAKVKRLDVLFGAFESPLLIPEAVFFETVENGLRKKEPDALLIKDGVDSGVLRVKKTKKKLNLPFLGAGESSVISLALETRTETVLIDENPARKTARRLGLTPIGTLGVLFRSLKLKKLSKSELFGLLDRMIQKDFRIGVKVLENFRSAVMALEK